jgi:hypothetical protein
MQYISVHWYHAFPDEPVRFLLELDERRWERRRVEVFSDGHFESADENTESAAIEIVPVPPLEEIAFDPQFDPVEITQEEFEKVWKIATDSKNRGRIRALACE